MTMTDSDKDIIGIGWRFPPQFLIEGNQTLMTHGVEDINQSLYILFTTHVGERIMHPNYGSALRIVHFESINEHFKNYMRILLSKSISLYETRIQPLKLEFSEDESNEGRYFMNLEYLIKLTNSKGNFVFPFYLNQ